MAEITEDMKIKDGQVIGYVRTDNVGSKCEFVICSVDDWKGMTDDEAHEAARDAMYESGMMEWGW